MAAVPEGYNYATAITKSDTVNIAVATPVGQNCRMLGIYVGGAGNIVAVFDDDTTQTFTGCLAGTILPIACKRVNSGSTTATNLLALFQI